MSLKALALYRLRIAKRSVLNIVRGWPYSCDVEPVRISLARIYDIQRRSLCGVNPYRIYYIDPRAIQLALAAERYNERCFRDFGLDGDWDKEVVPISSMTLYRGLKQHFVENFGWHETVLSPERVARLEWPEPRRYLRYDRLKFDKRAFELDQLWESLRTDGNLSRERTKYSDILNLAIDRAGRAIRASSGLHRLVMSQLLGLERVPCRISIIHKKCSSESVRDLNLAE
jgi:hypothetical protein